MLYKRFSFSNLLIDLMMKFMGNVGISGKLNAFIQIQRRNYAKFFEIFAKTKNIVFQVF